MKTANFTYTVNARSDTKENCFCRRTIYITSNAFKLICKYMVEINAQRIIEPRHDTTNNVVVRSAQTQISLGICPV